MWSIERDMIRFITDTRYKFDHWSGVIKMGFRMGMGFILFKKKINQKQNKNTWTYQSAILLWLRLKWLNFFSQIWLDFWCWLIAMDYGPYQVQNVSKTLPDIAVWYQLKELHSSKMFLGTFKSLLFTVMFHIRQIKHIMVSRWMSPSFWYKTWSNWLINNRGLII